MPSIQHVIGTNRGPLSLEGGGGGYSSFLVGLEPENVVRLISNKNNPNNGIKHNEWECERERHAYWRILKTVII